MSETYIKCKCNIIFIEDDFIPHFVKCEEFLKHFKHFDIEQGKLLKQHSDPKENLLIMRTLLEQYILLLDKKIKKSFDGCNGNPVNQIDNKDSGNVQNKSYNNIDGAPDTLLINDTHVGGNNPINIKSQIAIHPNNDVNLGIDKYDKTAKNLGGEINMSSKLDNKQQFAECCQLCEDMNYTYLDCLHQICSPCFEKYARKEIYNMKCVLCRTVISEDIKKMILGEEEYSRLMDKDKNIIDCPQLKEKIIFEEGIIDYNIKNDKAEILSKSSAEQIAENRYRCSSCKIDFCDGCKWVPYHIGKTSKENQKKCKYNNEIISSKNIGPVDDVCSNPECVAIFKTACTKVLKCGHKCWGFKREKLCPPCIDKECSQYVNLYDQDKESYCYICFVDGLGYFPIIVLSCTHIIHYKCMQAKLSRKWFGPRINFNHCLCPKCNNWVDCPNIPEIQDIIVQNKTLYNDICKKASERLKYEGLEKDRRLTDPNSRWYKKELEYSLYLFKYYMCYECQKPYYAGVIEDLSGLKSKYDPKDLICGAHVNNYEIAGMTECKIHGKEFIEYKCKFCCNIASRFRWGTTHFCEYCHARESNGDYLSKYSRDKLPKCKTSFCQLKVKHPDNGEEFGLGCYVCKNSNV